jgi:hypothetical protein
MTVDDGGMFFRTVGPAIQWNNPESSVSRKLHVCTNVAYKTLERERERETSVHPHIHKVMCNWRDSVDRI